MSNGPYLSSCPEFGGNLAKTMRAVYLLAIPRQFRANWSNCNGKSHWICTSKQVATTIPLWWNPYAQWSNVAWGNTSILFTLHSFALFCRDAQGRDMYSAWAGISRRHERHSLRFLVALQFPFNWLPFLLITALTPNVSHFCRDPHHPALRLRILRCLLLLAIW